MAEEECIIVHAYRRYGLTGEDGDEVDGCGRATERSPLQLPAHNS